MKNTYQKSYHVISAILLFLIMSLVTFAVTRSYEEKTVDISLDTIKQPKAVIEGKKVFLRFPVTLTNALNESQEVTLRMNCVQSTSSETYTLEPGKSKQTYSHPLSKEEVLEVNKLKRTKDSFPCDIAVIIDPAEELDSNPSNNYLFFDLYKNRVRVDIKNVRKK